MRIVGGTRRGRRLLPPRSHHTRPTADRVRETLFNVLGQMLDGGEVLDLYAGTGALGLEALSRGAERAVLVDLSAEAAELCQKNAALLGFDSVVTVLRLRVDRAVERLAREGRRFVLAFADPPYAARAGGWVVEAVSPLLTEGGVLVVEHDRRELLPEAGGTLVRADQRRFGDTVLSFFQAVSSKSLPSGTPAMEHS
jgi:16S rRNA (guanine966-N2)-methyltransferase